MSKRSKCKKESGTGQCYVDFFFETVAISGCPVVLPLRGKWLQVYKLINGTWSTASVSEQGDEGTGSLSLSPYENVGPRLPDHQ